MIVAFNYNGVIKPVLDVDDRPDQVVVRFIPYRQEHFTLHLDSGSIISTHHSDNKQPSVWDDLCVETAENLGLRNPERHRGYIKHSPLVKIENVDGYNILGRRIDLDAFTPRQHYFRNISHTIITPFNPFMLEFYLSTVDNPCPVNMPRVGTILGDLCFSFNR
jgi:hypothetical protein